MTVISLVRNRAGRVGELLGNFCSHSLPIDCSKKRWKIFGLATPTICLRWRNPIIAHQVRISSTVRARTVYTVEHAQHCTLNRVWSCAWLLIPEWGLSTKIFAFVKQHIICDIFLDAKLFRELDENSNASNQTKTWVLRFGLHQKAYVLIAVCLPVPRSSTSTASVLAFAKRRITSSKWILRQQTAISIHDCWYYRHNNQNRLNSVSKMALTLLNHFYWQIPVGFLSVVVLTAFDLWMAELEVWKVRKRIRSFLLHLTLSISLCASHPTLSHTNRRPRSLLWSPTS